MEISSAHQSSMRPGEPGTQSGARCCYVCPCQAALGRGCQGRAHPCTRLFHPVHPLLADGARQPSTWAHCHGDAPDLHLRLLQGLTMVVMKACVTWLLFKQGLRLLPLCWQHAQPLSSTGHYCSASSLHSMSKCAESCMHLDLFSAPLPARGHFAKAQMLCVHRGSQDAPTPPARMASPFVPPPRASSPRSQPDVQPDRWANGPALGDLAIQIVVLSCTEQPSPKQPPCQWQPAGEGARGSSDSPGVCRMRPRGAGWMRLEEASWLSGQAPPSPCPLQR